MCAVRSVIESSFAAPILAGLRGALGAHFPWADTNRLGVVPDRGRGLGHTAPTYLCRDLAGLHSSDGHRGSLSLFPHLAGSISLFAHV